MHRNFIKSVLASLALTVCLPAATFEWIGTTDSDWALGGNWTGSSAPSSGGIEIHRLNINNNAGSALVYTSAQDGTEGFTELSNTDRSIVIASSSNTNSGTLQIDSGTLIFSSTKEPVLGAGASNAWAGTADLIVNGGNLQVTTSGFGGDGELAILSRGAAAAQATVTVNSGTLSAGSLTFGRLAGGAGTGVINFNGGVSTVRRIINVAAMTGSTSVNFDGGTLRSGDTDNNEDWISANQTGPAVNILAGGATFDSNGQTNQRLQIAMSGAGGVTVTDSAAGGGEVVFNANNSYAGSTTIDASGTLVLGNNNSVGELGTGTLTNNGTLVFNRSGTFTQSAHTGVSAGLSGGDYVQRGSGTTILDVANTTDGSFTVTGGALRVTDSASLGSTTGDTFIPVGGRVELVGSVTVTGETVHLTGDGVNYRGALQSQSGDNTWDGPINLTGEATNNENRVGALDGTSLTITGTITDTSSAGDTHFVIRSEDSGVVTLGGSGHSWGGETRVYNGLLRLSGSDNVLPTTQAVSIGVGGLPGGTLDLNGLNQTIGGLRSENNAAANGQILTNQGGTDSILTIDNTGDYNFGGTIQDGATNSVSLVKQGAGTQTLSGASTFTGGTTVSAGTLYVNGSLGGPVSVDGGTLGGTGTVVDMIVASTATLAPGNSIGTLGVNSLDLAGSLLVEYDGAATGTIDLLNVTGALDIGTGSVDFSQLGDSADDPAYVFATYGSLTGDFGTNVSGLPAGYAIDYNYLGANQIALVIPEPATAALGALGLLALLRRRR